jgi:hypothetical protein
MSFLPGAKQLGSCKNAEFSSDRIAEGAGPAILLSVVWLTGFKKSEVSASDRSK